MKVETTRFGLLEVDERKIISFSGGIPGFENLHKFIIIPAEGAEDIQWLQSLEEPAIALLIIDPFKFFKDYDCNIPGADVKELELKEASEALVLVTITVPQNDPAGVTANLVAPIVVNTRLNKGKQVILNNSPYTTKHRLFPEVKTKPVYKRVKSVGEVGA